ncbi:hypothetical protein B7W89_18840 [Agrobacterium tumefaciens]|uniref:hypothetical protein n=1 Tax=Agrobacterium tumefaciens TaxID=358 RepID=UPI000B3FA54F|nr:hypothetical protein [Agrobacterium tumefaciens]NSY03250.1 hypothetical protein [Agrobacterium tumefaciens]OVE87980.1 hypothetical protein B7W89_18840 [Agrobacterium tumefaciens]
MNETQKGWLLFSSSLTFMAVVLFTLFWITKGEADGAKRFIYDYQTLITGIAAVFAAGVTVRQMITSDKKQDKRHQEGMAFAMRGEMRRMDRGLHPQLQDLETVAQRMNKLNFDPTIYIDQPDPYYKWFHEIVPPLQPIATDIVAIVERQAIRDAAEFFDGNLLIAFESARENALKVQKYIALHLDAHNISDIASANAFHRYEQEIWPEVGAYRVEQTAEFRSRIWMLIRELKRAAAELDGLKSRFKID